MGTAQIVAGAGGEEEFAGLRESILQMRPGDLFVMDYVTMYGSMDTFRRDKGDMKAVGLADQEGVAFRRSARVDRLHTPRIPHIPRPGQVWESSRRQLRSGRHTLLSYISASASWRTRG